MESKRTTWIVIFLILIGALTWVGGVAKAHTDVGMDPQVLEKACWEKIARLESEFGLWVKVNSKWSCQKERTVRELECVVAEVEFEMGARDHLPQKCNELLRYEETFILACERPECV